MFILAPYTLDLDSLLVLYMLLALVLQRCRMQASQSGRKANRTHKASGRENKLDMSIVIARSAWSS